MGNLGRESPTTSPEQETGLAVTTGRWTTVIASEVVRYKLLCKETVLHCAWNSQEIPEYTVGIKEHTSVSRPRWSSELHAGSTARVGTSERLKLVLEPATVNQMVQA
jgi:hypothetical protein